MNRPIRVLHCPTGVGGNPQALAKAERELGLKSTAIMFEQNYLGYTSDEVLFSPGESQWKRELKQWSLMWRIIREFDVVHYNFGSPVLPYYSPPQRANYRGAKYPGIFYQVYGTYKRMVEALDLPLLKRAGKGIMITYQGDDARQGDFCRSAFQISPATEVDPDYYTKESDDLKRQAISHFAKYADRIYALNPDLLHVLPKRAEFLPYANVDLREWSPAPTASQSQRLTVLHAPTHRGAKGTRYILEAVRQLQEKDGLDFEFRLVEGMSRAEARAVYERADLLIDQLVCGWYGGLTVEFMALAKPVICYVREDDLKFIPAQMRSELPVINASPATIYSVLKNCLTVDKGRLPTIGRQGRDYVERWHDPLQIAARLKRDYEAALSSRAAKRL